MALDASISPHWDWPAFWAPVQAQLKACRYRGSTRKLYRNVLRGFRSHCRCRPAEVTRRHVREYLHELGRRGLSSSWIGTNVSVLRTVFDGMWGAELTGGCRCPRPSRKLPEVLSPTEVRAILAQAQTVRDQLLLGLIHGCGLKVGEACRLRWGDIDAEQEMVRIFDPASGRSRSVPLPRQVMPVLREGVQSCAADGFLFLGRKEGTCLSVRMAEYIVQRAVESIGAGLPVSSMSLRHAFAVHSLLAGMNVRQLQEILGHVHIESTMRYLRLIPALDAISPLDGLACPPAPVAPENPPALTGDLFAEDLDVGPLMAPDTWRDRARALYASLKVQLGGRFLANRAIRNRPG